jgi:hypothetical protein
VLRGLVEEIIDLDNLCGGLVLAVSEQELPPDEAFLSGGRRVALAAFRVAAGSRNPDRAADYLAAGFGETEVARLVRRHASDPVALEEALLQHRSRQLRRQGRLVPLGPAPLLGYLLRLRIQTAVLGRMLWGVAFGVPPELRLPDLAGVA